MSGGRDAAVDSVTPIRVQAVRNTPGGELPVHGYLRSPWCDRT